MEHSFRTFNGNKPVDLVPYVRDYMSKNEGIELLVGSDSQNCGLETRYAVVVALYRPTKGAHLLYSKIITPRIPVKRNVERLVNEVWFSTEVAETFKHELGVVARWIDIDLNPDPKYGSNKAFTDAVGIVTGMGYNVRHKGLNPMLTYAADALIK